MPNTNCLEGFRCPACGSEEPFKICVTTMMEVYDNGTENNEDTEWDEDSRCDCVKCGHSGKVWQFWIRTQEVRKVERTKAQNLPLLIGQMTTKEGRSALERKLKQC